MQGLFEYPTKNVQYSDVSRFWVSRIWIPNVIFFEINALKENSINSLSAIPRARWTSKGSRFFCKKNKKNLCAKILDVKVPQTQCYFGWFEANLNVCNTFLVTT